VYRSTRLASTVVGVKYMPSAMTQIDGTRTAHSTAHRTKPLRHRGGNLPACRHRHRRVRSRTFWWPRNTRSPGRRRRRRRGRGHAFFFSRLVHVLDDGERLSRCVQDGGRSIRPPAISICSVEVFKSIQRLFL
jgi:hypothetical protein